MATTHAPKAMSPMTWPSNRRSANRPVATPLTIVTTPSSTVGLSAGSRDRDSVIRGS